jgi:hypothetical protein
VAVSVSAVVLLGILVFTFVKKSGLSAAHAVVCVLPGFFLAGSGATPGIRSGVESAIQVIGQINF